jgi:sugar-specific transcriptional regulator TrmB
LEEFKLSLERVIKAIIGLGLSEFDAQVYIFLALNGPQTVNQISAMMKKSKQQVYRSLKSLEENSVVVVSGAVPAVFSAASFEKVLDLLSIKKERQARALEKVREDLLNSWQRVIESNSANGSSSSNQKSRKEEDGR